MKTIELSDFYNSGFGWICKHCEREFSGAETNSHSRLMTEGEAESKTPSFSSRALARWADPARTTLICPQCGLIEPVDRH
ncbi:MAG: hypothetical protein KIS76_17695 [Pyrinomonadaceae bacterium]|nr:hypothetical protein [Pyrinomonadaceae bacterium]